ncbi:MAG: transposase, partial [Muribaculaceae bacterium]
RIGGMPDHIHLLVDIHPTISVTEFVRKLKESASKWLRSQSNFPDFDGWGESFAAFSYSHKDVDIIINYIKNQKTHHQKVCFADEYRQ